MCSLPECKFGSALLFRRYSTTFSCAWKQACNKGVQPLSSLEFISPFRSEICKQILCKYFLKTINLPVQNYCVNWVINGVKNKVMFQVTIGFVVI